MAQKNIKSLSFLDGLNEAIALINSRTPSLKHKHILIVPDKYTLNAETRLFSGTKGAFDVEVLTFARLFYRLCGGGDYIAKEAAIMLIRGICQEIDLECYKKSASFSGFSEKVYETINLLIDSGIDVMEASSSDAATAVRLEDIKKIYHEYKKQTKDKYIDRNGRLELLEGAISIGNQLENYHFYVTSFMQFTAGEKRVIDRLSEKAASVTIITSQLTPPPIRAKEIEVYDCAGGVAELKAVARRIRSAVTEGARYKDMCIVMPSLSFNQAERIFREYDIPFYTDYAFELSSTPLSVYLQGIIELIEKRFRRHDMIEISKNIYFGIPKKHSDIFENFINEYNIDYLAFKDEFQAKKFFSSSLISDDNKASLDIAEHTRKTIMRRLSTLEGFYKNIQNAADFALFVRKAIELATDEAGSVDGLETLEGASAGIEIPIFEGTSSGEHREDTKQKIEEILKLMEQILGKAPHRASFLREVFLEGLAQGKVMAIPNLSDSVNIAVPSTFRGQEFSYVYVLGMNEGQMPAPKPTSGLFSLEENAIDDYNPPKENENVTELDHILYAAKDKIFISYDSASESGMACYLKEFIQKNRAKTAKNSLEQEESILTFFDDLNGMNGLELAGGSALGTDAKESDANADTQTSRPDYSLVIDYCSHKAGAIEFFLQGLSSYKKLATIQSFYGSVYRAIKDKGIDKYLYTKKHEEKISCGGLITRSGNISVSRLQEYFGCPFAHFIKYGLRAKPKKESDLKPVDIGTILHAVAEQFVKDRNLWQNVKETSKKLLDDIFETMPNVRLKISSKALEKLYEEAAALCEVLKSHFLHASFQPLGQEISLKESSFLKPLVFETDGAKFALNGSVDYADVYKNKVRIIDYKTGRIDFSFSDIFYGRKIQLPLYMQAFVESGFEACGFFFFPFSTNWKDNEKTHRLKGVFDRDIDVLLAMDDTLIEGKSSSIIAAKTAIKDDELKLYGRHDYALYTDEIANLCLYAKDVALQAIKEIATGYVAARPSKNTKGSSCDYCDYSSICAQKDLNPRTLTTLDKKEVVKIEKV